MSATLPRPALTSAGPQARRLPDWWPLAALLAAAAALRFSTLNLQSFWYDEAFTPVHVLHASLQATLHSVVHTENSPPLWYLIAWVDVRLFGDGEIALRLPSALAGTATVALAWAIGCEIAGRRCALICAALVAFNPLFFWYSQEARVYALFAMVVALAMLCCLRAHKRPTPGRMAAFALAGALALLTHYFSVFLLAGMALWLVWERSSRRAALPACAALAGAGLALLPLVIAQGGHGTQWIGRWALSSRMGEIPRYFLTGSSGAPLGHGIELLVALPLLCGIALALGRSPAHSGAREQLSGPGRAGPGAARLSSRSGPDGLGAAAAPILFAAAGILVPLALALLGADYLAPRNLLGAMVPVTAAIAVALASPRAGLVGAAMAAAAALAFLAISVDIDLSPRLQRGNWRGLAHALGRGGPARAITTVELGAAPLEYYLPGLHNLSRGSLVSVDEIDQTGYAPLRSFAARAPARGFAPIGRLDVNGLIAYRFSAAAPRGVSEATLRRHVITLAPPEVLVGAGARVTSVVAGG